MLLLPLNLHVATFGQLIEAFAENTANEQQMLIDETRAQRHKIKHHTIMK
jgi:hypothetical protein